VVLFARGAHRAAMREQGLRITGADGHFDVRPRVAESLDAIGPVDVVILGVKAHQLTAIAPGLDVLFKPDTVVVSTQNGIPWWYFQHLAGPMAGWHLEHVDPGGVIARAIAPERVVGSLAYFSTEVSAPGVIHHIEGHRLSLGEPDGRRSDRCRAIAEALIAGGLRCPVSGRFRHEVWVKLLGNIAFNPISVLTRATLEAIVRQPDVAQLVRQVMVETEAVASRLDIELPISIDQRMAGAEKVGAHKTSMLQDFEAGRPMEIEAVVGAVLELGDRLGLPMPATRSVYGCVKLLSAS
jgi:2-dehydropantoate 2-reductase